MRPRLGILAAAPLMLAACAEDAPSGPTMTRTQVGDGATITRIQPQGYTEAEQRAAIDTTLEIVADLGCQMTPDIYHAEVGKRGYFNAAERAERLGTIVELEQLNARSLGNDIVRGLVQNGFFELIDPSQNLVESKVGDCAS